MTAILRIKRKHTDSPLQAILVQDNKRQRLFTLSVNINTEEPLKHAVKLAKHAARNTQPLNPSLDARREVLRAQSLQRAKNARFIILNSNRTPVDGVLLLEISRQDSRNTDTAEQMSTMFNACLKISDTEVLPDKEENVLDSSRKPSETETIVTDDEYVFDLYYHEPTASVKTMLDNSTVGTLEWHQEPEILMDDIDDSSDYSEDSNCEDYFGIFCFNWVANEYPDEDDELEIQNDSDPFQTDEFDSSDYEFV
jgi:hypothetical protein